MAYTIPEYVDTQEQAILAVASAVKGEQVTGGDGSVNTALDILADALAGENVTVPMTDQGAILALAQYVGGGGGGGGESVEFGIVLSVDGEMSATFYGRMADYISDQTIPAEPESTDFDYFVSTVSAGAVVQYYPPENYDVASFGLYLFTSKDNFIAGDEGISIVPEDAHLGIIPAQAYGAFYIDIIPRQI